MSDGMIEMMMRCLMVAVLAVAGCAKLEQVGRAPEFTGLEPSQHLPGGFNLFPGSQFTLHAVANKGLAGGTLVVTDNNFSTDIATTLADATTSTIQVSTGLDATFSTALSGNGSLAKTGTGTLTLSGTNTYEGGTTVSAGTLAATDATQFGTGAITVQSGGNVTLATPTAFNQSVTIDGTGASVVGDAIGGTLGMTSSFTQFGSSGTATTLTVSNGGSLAGANLDFGANADQNFTASVASGGTITAGATVVIGRNATAASDVTVTGADSALTVGDFANSTFDDEIMVGYGNSAQATLTIADGGRVSSTYTYIGENGGDGFLHIADGGTLTTRRVVLTQASDANNGGTLQVDSGGTLQVSKVDGYAYYGQIGNEGDQGLLRLNGGTLQVHDTTAIFVNAQTELTSGTTSVIDTAGVNNFVGFATNVSGAGNLQVSGGGGVAVVGANTFSGRVQIEDGTFILDTTASIDASAGVDLGTDATLDLTATFLDYAGVSAARALHSRSLRPLIETDTASRDFAYNEWQLNASRCGVELELTLGVLFGDDADE